VLDTVGEKGRFHADFAVVQQGEKVAYSERLRKEEFGLEIDLFRYCVEKFR